MRPGMKMMLLAGDDRRGKDRYRERRNDEPMRNEYNGSEINYGGYDRSDNYRERMSPTDNYEIESRRRFPRDERGRFLPRSEMDERGDAESHYPTTPYVPPMYDRTMPRIGFNAGREIEPDYRSSMYYPDMDEMSNRGTSPMMGGAKSNGGKLSKPMVEEWMANLQNEDGSTGPHWTLEQVKQLKNQRHIEADDLELWAALNMMYSDYCKVAKKNNANTMDFYIDMALAFLNDKDAHGDKLSKYYHGVVNG